MEISPCAYCGGEPTLEMSKHGTGIWAKAGRYVCLNIGCPGQGKRASICFRYLHNWNHRQYSYRRTIQRAKQAIPELWRHEKSGDSEIAG